MKNWKRWLAAVWIASALLCVLIDLLYFPRTLVFPDEQRFLASAIKLATTGEFWVGVDRTAEFSGPDFLFDPAISWKGLDRAYEMPGPALFFTPAVWLLGPAGALVPIRLMQALLVLLQSGLVALTAKRLFRSELTAFLAGSMTAFYPFLLFYQGLLLSETLFITLLLAGVASLYWWRERGCRADHTLVLTCLCFATATLSKATLTFLPPLLIAATAWLAGARWRRALAILATSSILYCAFLSPWWIRNAVVLDAFVPFTTSSAHNLYLGNNPRNPDGGIDLTNNVEPEVFKRISAMPNEVDRQRAFSKAALDHIKADPGAFIRVSIKKFFRFWNVIPNAQELKTGIYAVITAASFGPVLLLAIICAIWRRRDWRSLAPLYLIVAYFTAVHVVTIASLRYRLPIEPILIVLAADPLSAAIRRLRQAALREESHAQTP